jgi:hypothetical protein
MALRIVEVSTHQDWQGRTLALSGSCRLADGRWHPLSLRRVAAWISGNAARILADPGRWRDHPEAKRQRKDAAGICAYLATGVRA